MGVSRIVFLLAIAIAMAMFVVSERNNTIEIGYQIAKLQKSCAELSEKNRNLAYYVDKLKSPDVIAYKVQSMKLSLNQQQEFRGTLVASRTQPKEDATKLRINRNLVTQKEPATTGRSSHY
ncbi:MAG: hypothetical protein HZB37_12875 [Planctomycetes bacterium]|nr:hypothetical protein [Planctomycetota bacterium]